MTNWFFLSVLLFIFKKNRMQQPCVSCGAQLDIEAGDVSVVCKYCDTILLVERGVLTDSGQKSQIMSFPTMFEIGKNFFAVLSSESNDKIWWVWVDYFAEEDFRKSWKKVHLVKLYVSGQIRYTNDWWFWDDWVVLISDLKANNLGIDKAKQLILQEDEWIISIFELEWSGYDEKSKKDFTEINSFDLWKNWNWYFIQEKWVANVEWIKWNFPFFISNPKKVEYIDMFQKWKLTMIKRIGDSVLHYKGR